VTWGIVGNEDAEKEQIAHPRLLLIQYCNTQQ
jgi:hypothetical protein